MAKYLFKMTAVGIILFFWGSGVCMNNTYAQSTGAPVINSLTA